MATRSQSARLRKTFQYPDSDSDIPEALDEEEQAHLIQHLHTRSTTTNTLYTGLFTAFPLLLTLAYLPPLSTTSSGTTPPASLALLAVSSLLCSAWWMYTAGAGEAKPTPAGTKSARGTKKWMGGAADGPIQRYLPPLNACLAGVVLVAGLLRAEDGAGLAAWRLSALPAVALGVVGAVRGVMGGVDVGELEGLRYGYKGA